MREAQRKSNEEIYGWSERRHEVSVNARDWVSWRQLIHFGDACGEQPKLEKEKHGA